MTAPISNGWLTGSGDDIYWAPDGQKAGSLLGYSALVTAILEYVPELRWPAAGDVYARMRNDGQLTGSMKAYTLPIRRAQWGLDPAGCRPEVVAQCSEDLGLPVIGQEPAQTGARRRGVIWSEHLRTALLSGVFGHMPFEQYYDASSGRARLVALRERMPKTVRGIYLTPEGDIDYVTQETLPGEAEPRKIKTPSLVWYVNEREGLAWRGRSLMRSAYPYWQIKDLMLRVHAAFIKKAGMGVPYANVPNGADPIVYQQAERAIANYQASEHAHLLLPEGVKAGIAGVTGSVPDTLSFIKQLNGEMSLGFLTQWMNLGTTESGNRALAEVFVDMFMNCVQDFGDQHADQATRQIMVPYVDLNWGEDEAVPAIVCGNVGANHAVTAQAMSALYSCGALSWDADLENYIRELYKLPHRPAGAPHVPAKVAPPAPAADPAPMSAA